MKRYTLHATRSIGIIACALFAMPASAASLYSEPRQIEVAPNQTFEVSLFLDTQDDDINAVEGTVEFPADLLELKEIRDGNSIINFWVERPTVSQTSVAFSGIIPGGYRFPKGLVLSLVFAAKGNGSGIIHVEKARTLRNDGQGTEAPLSVAFSSFTVSEAPEFPAPAVAPILDTDIPESFRPELSRDPSIFDGKWFLSFATQDKGTGIERYEVQESYAWGRGSWVKASSPHVLIGQNPALPIRVKAIDRAGNERIESAIAVPHVRTAFENDLMIGIIILVILMLLVKWIVRKQDKI
jgi:hypothetical protein